MFGPNINDQTIEQIKLINQRLSIAQRRQKSYADKRQKPLEFAIGDHIFLKFYLKLGQWPIG